MKAARAVLGEITGLFVGSIAETVVVLLVILASAALARGRAGIWAGVLLCVGVSVALLFFTAVDARRKRQRTGRP